MYLSLDILNYYKEKEDNMELKAYFLNKYKNGQDDSIDETKTKSDTCKVIKVFDGDVTTYLYELPKWFDEENEANRSELLSAIKEEFLQGNINDYGIKGSFNSDSDGVVSFYLETPGDDFKDYTVTDEDGDEFYFQYIEKSAEKYWLHHDLFASNTKQMVEDECGESYAAEFYAFVKADRSDEN